MVLQKNVMIRSLDTVTINRIAAGEVIDRPASVVKELIDNSIDAQATVITIEIESGGKTLIKISDNGFGILAEDLPLAGLQHTTSKIRKFEDIYSVQTMGFRGEALASICNISDVSIFSKTADQSAHQIKISFGDQSPIQSVAHPQGTTVQIKNIFSQIPVRKKYLKSNATEFSYIYEIVQQFSLIYPAINFKLVHDQKEILNTTGISDPKEIFCIYFGTSLKSHLLDINLKVGDLHVSGFMTDPKMTHSNRSRQWFAVNKRIVKSALFHHVLSNCFYDRIPQRRYPMILLHLSISEHLIDINIHPQKHELKFLDSNPIYDSILKALNAALSFELAPVSISTACSKSNVLVHSFASQSKPLFNLDLLSPSPQTLPQQIQSEQLQYFQTFNTYLIINSDSGIWILDQHAVHERILYEQLKQSQDSCSHQQGLLIPEIIELNPSEYATYENSKSFFEQLQFEIEEFGNNQIVIRKIPSHFKNINYTAFIQDFLVQIHKLPIPSQLTETQLDRLQTKACKSAIKAGKKLSELEVKQLIADFLKTPANFTCPHGRPLFIKLEKKDLEKFFHRS